MKSRHVISLALFAGLATIPACGGAAPAESVDSAAVAQRNGFAASAANAAVICSIRRREIRESSNMDVFLFID